MYFYFLEACVRCPGGLRRFVFTKISTFLNYKPLLGDQAASGGFFSPEFALFEIISPSSVTRRPPAVFFHQN